MSEPNAPRYFVRANERSAPLGDTEVALGRSPYCTLPIDDRSVSRLHAVFRWHGAQIEIEDLGSANGTFVHGERIAAPTVVRPGDAIRVGSVQAELIEVRASPLAETDTGDAARAHRDALPPRRR